MTMPTEPEPTTGQVPEWITNAAWEIASIDSFSGKYDFAIRAKRIIARHAPVAPPSPGDGQAEAVAELLRDSNEALAMIIEGPIYEEYEQSQIGVFEDKEYDWNETVEAVKNSDEWLGDLKGDPCNEWVVLYRRLATAVRRVASGTESEG